MSALKFFQSKSYQNIMGFVYGWGASAVIIGALFKIMHFPGAGVVLTIGMLVEACIFFLSAFEPPLEHYNWGKVFPELSNSELAPVTQQHVSKIQQGGSVAGTVETVTNISTIDEKDIEQLREGIHKIVKSAERFEDATLNVPEFAKKLIDATASFEQLGEKTMKAGKVLEDSMMDYQKLTVNIETSSNSFANLSTTINEQMDKFKSNSDNNSQQVSALSKNISALNAIYELQINETQSTLESFRGMQNDMNELMENVSLSLDNTKLFKQETQQLANNVASLNSVYGNMLSIVNG
ncbi:MAG: gliding motility protein GldL [Culturomica sp.]|jgi:gliding motility-associated protein GldL|nr:gliding motility protein GldL [Culturomica sp.]